MNLAVRKVRSFARKRKEQIASKMLVANVAFNLSRIFNFKASRSLTKGLAGLKIIHLSENPNP